MVDNSALDLNRLCRICSSDLQDKGVGIFSAECMENLVGEKIRRYLYFSLNHGGIERSLSNSQEKGHIIVINVEKACANRDASKSILYLAFSPDDVSAYVNNPFNEMPGVKQREFPYRLCHVSIKDSLPKMVCTTCLKKLENIHRFAKMAAEMQEKFRMLLATKQEKPKIKIKSLDDINKEAEKECEKTIMNEENIGCSDGSSGGVGGGSGAGKAKFKTEVEDNFEMNLDVAVEVVGDSSSDAKLDDITASNPEAIGNPRSGGRAINKKNAGMMNGTEKTRERRKSLVDDDNEADTSDSDRLVIQDEEKPNPSLLHCLLLKGKQQMSLDMDHDYPMKVKEEGPEIKEEPADLEDEDIAEEIAEDRLNQIIKDEMDSETDQESEQEDDSDIEITEMEVKVDPTLYFSNASQSGNEIEQDSQDGQDGLTVDGSMNSNSNSDNSVQNKTQTLSDNEKKGIDKSKSNGDNRPLVMTRLQQKMNPVIASLKLGKPYKCTLCPRSFITDIGLQNHLWSHLPKARKSQSNGGAMIPKNIDLEDSQVYSSNGVLHTAQPSENPHLLKYVCPICGKKISTKGNLKVHLETHRPKGKYGCDICGRVFKTAANLFRHKDYHGGVQFPCPVCGRVYPTNSTLRAHSITHSDLRPHKCPLCSKTFKRNQDLKFHINQHTGARPYQCPYCPKAFASSGNCFSHRKRMHPLEVERDKERAAEIMG